jgi:hypothetical protein
MTSKIHFEIYRLLDDVGPNPIKKSAYTLELSVLTFKLSKIVQSLCKR